MQRRQALTALALVAGAAPAYAQAYPSKPVKIIVPAPPGGTADIFARALGQRMQAAMGQPFVVEYKPGAATNIGTDFVAKSAPDGYTLLFNGITLASNPALFAKLPFNPATDLAPIIPALEQVLGGALGDNVGSFNFKAITDRFSELMYAYPFRVPARFALIIRAVVSQEGLAMRLDPSFRIIRVAYPYVARRLLAGDTAEMREKLLEVLFDREGRLQIQRLESLLAVVQADEGAGADLVPVAGAGLKLLLGEEGRSLRQRLLLTLVRDDRLNTEDLRGLVALLGRTFGPRQFADRVRERLTGTLLGRSLLRQSAAA